jgi:hypothetical protein
MPHISFRDSAVRRGGELSERGIYVNMCIYMYIIKGLKILLQRLSFDCSIDFTISRFSYTTKVGSCAECAWGLPGYSTFNVICKKTLSGQPLSLGALASKSSGRCLRFGSLNTSFSTYAAVLSFFAGQMVSRQASTNSGLGWQRANK